MDLDPTIAALHAEAPLTDVHAHPSLKTYLFNRDIRRHYRAGRRFNPLGTRTDLPSLRQGGVRVAWAAHYVPELPMFEQSRLTRLTARLLCPPYRGGFDRCVWLRLQDMMDQFEQQVADAAPQAAIATSVAQLKATVAEDRIAFVHTIEGGHVLQGDVDRLAVLAQRGVAMLTLAHFFPNGLAAQARCVPQEGWIARLSPYDFPDADQPLTDFGSSVLRAMASLGMIADLTHCTPEARRAIYDAVQGDMPLVASHVGCRQLCDQPYNLDQHDVDAIVAGGGAIGVIFMPFHLNGKLNDDGIEAICRTMMTLHDMAGSWDHVMIGTDFDGFTVPPLGLHNPRLMGKLTQRLLDAGVTRQDMLKILGGNALRVLEKGWRPQTTA